MAHWEGAGSEKGTGSVGNREASPSKATSRVFDEHEPRSTNVGHSGRGAFEVTRDDQLCRQSDRTGQLSGRQRHRERAVADRRVPGQGMAGDDPALRAGAQSARSSTSRSSSEEWPVGSEQGIDVQCQRRPDELLARVVPPREQVGEPLSFLIVRSTSRRRSRSTGRPSGADTDAASPSALHDLRIDVDREVRSRLELEAPQIFRFQVGRVQSCACRSPDPANPVRGSLGRRSRSRRPRRQAP